MAPARKKSRLAPNENETEQVLPPARNEAQTDTQTQHDESGAEREDVITSESQKDNAPSRPSARPSPPASSQNRGSWYSASSWRTKASPVVAQATKESVWVDKGVSSGSTEQETEKRRSSQSVSKSFKGSSRKSIPLAAEATRVHAGQSEVSLPPKQQRQSPMRTESATEKKAETKETETNAATEETKTEDPEQHSVSQELVVAQDGSKKLEMTETARPASGAWLGWWSRPDGYADSTTDLKMKNDNKGDADGPGDQATNATDVEESAKRPPIQNEIAVDEESSSLLQPEMSINNSYSKSWFRLWSNTQNEQAKEEDRERRKSEQDGQTGVNITTEPAQAVEDVKTVESQKPKESVKSLEEERPKSSGWAFWSRDRPKEEALPPEEEGTQKQIGELAVADTPSQSHPEAAQYNRDEQKDDKPEIKRNNSLLRSKRGRSDKAKDLSGDTTAAATPVNSQVQTPTISQLQTPIDTPEGSPAPVQKGKKAQQSRPNIILPTFRDTYPPAPNPGVVQRIAEYIANTLHIPGYDPLRPPHSYINPTPPKVRKAIAIGVHGFFPAPLIQRVLGQPTGTSIRFANYAAASIKQWCQEHQPEIKDVEVETVALEGEGLIADRVATLWKLLLNWLSHLRKADFILVACHSQGVPVAIMLVAKLIQLGCLSPHARLGICAMAGINLGPFVEYKSRLFGGTALELFDFCESTSKVSVAYAESLDICLRHGVRITFVGSLDDQLVSLESSLHTPLTHPYVSRTVFIDGRLHTSNFLNHLVTFAVKLRNLGVSDHGLLREISAPLAGSLVGGEGHSRVYDDPAVYRTATEFTLESTDVSPAHFIPPANPEEKRKSMEAATQRRASMAAYPSNVNAANSMRRGSLSAVSLNPPGIAPVIAPYEAPGAVGAAEKNPYVLPWAVRGMLEEELVKRDSKMQEEVRQLVKEFEGWRPLSKVLKDVRWRLEGVRSML